jgi:hypothetical protein
MEEYIIEIPELRIPKDIPERIQCSPEVFKGYHLMVMPNHHEVLHEDFDQFYSSIVVSMFSEGVFITLDPSCGDVGLYVQKKGLYMPNVGINDGLVDDAQMDTGWSIIDKPFNLMRQIPLYNNLIDYVFDSWKSPEAFISEGYKGDCEDWGIFFTSLLTALGKPAVLVVGKQKVDGGWGDHAWVETIIDGKRYVLDATRELKKLKNPDEAYGTDGEYKPYYMINHKRLLGYQEDWNSGSIMKDDFSGLTLHIQPVPEVFKAIDLLQLRQSKIEYQQNIPSRVTLEKNASEYTGGFLVTKFFKITYDYVDLNKGWEEKADGFYHMQGGYHSKILGSVNVCFVHDAELQHKAGLAGGSGNIFWGPGTLNLKGPGVNIDNYPGDIREGVSVLADLALVKPPATFEATFTQTWGTTDENRHENTMVFNFTCVLPDEDSLARIINSAEDKVHKFKRYLEYEKTPR